MNGLGHELYGMPITPVSPMDAAILHGSALTTAPSPVGRLDPENPMIWLVGLGALTLGLVAFSTSVKLGPLKASISG